MLPRALSRQQSGLSASTSGRDVAATCPTVQRAWWSWLASQGRRSSSTSSSSRHAAPPPAASKGRSAAAYQFNPVKLDLPAAEFTRIRTAEYISSSVDLKGCPPQRHPEFAVIGRSNVGKSSLINMLTQQQGLAKVSKEPGMTRCINHFLINKSWYLVDLPGYGYAKASKEDRSRWLDFTKAYFLEREVLAGVLLAADATLPPQQVDLECANWLAECQVPFALVFTKVDAPKKKGPPPAANMKAFTAELLKDWETAPPVFPTSAREGRGRGEVLSWLGSMRRLEETEGE